jgi:hypothetical protein
MKVILNKRILNRLRTTPRYTLFENALKILEDGSLEIDFTSVEYSKLDSDTELFMFTVITEKCALVQVENRYNSAEEIISIVIDDDEKVTSRLQWMYVLFYQTLEYGLGDVKLSDDDLYWTQLYITGLVDRDDTDVMSTGKVGSCKLTSIPGNQNIPWEVEILKKMPIVQEGEIL